MSYVVWSLIRTHLHSLTLDRTSTRYCANLRISTVLQIKVVFICRVLFYVLKGH